MPTRRIHPYQSVIGEAPDRRYPVAATARFVSMVSERSTAGARSGFPCMDLNSWRSSIKSGNRSRSDHQWRADSWDLGDDSYLCKNQLGNRQFDEISDQRILLEGNYAAPILAPRSFDARSDRIQEAGFKTQEVRSRSCGNLWREASIQGDDDGKIDGRQVFDEMPKLLVSSYNLNSNSSIFHRQGHDVFAESPVRIQLHWDEEARMHATRDLLKCVIDHRIAARSRLTSEREAIIRKCNQAEQWLRKRSQQQDAVPRNVEPLLWSYEIREKTMALETDCIHIMKALMEDDVDDNEEEEGTNATDSDVVEELVKDEDYNNDEDDDALVGDMTESDFECQAVEVMKSVLGVMSQRPMDATNGGIDENEELLDVDEDLPLWDDYKEEIPWGKVCDNGTILKFLPGQCNEARCEVVGSSGIPILLNVPISLLKKIIQREYTQSLKENTMCDLAVLCMDASSGSNSFPAQVSNLWGALALVLVTEGAKGECVQSPESSVMEKRVLSFDPGGGSVSDLRILSTLRQCKYELPLIPCIIVIMCGFDGSYTEMAQCLLALVQVLWYHSKLAHQDRKEGMKASRKQLLGAADAISLIAGHLTKGTISDEKIAETLDVICSILIKIGANAKPIKQPDFAIIERIVLIFYPDAETTQKYCCHQNASQICEADYTREEGINLSCFKVEEVVGTLQTNAWVGEIVKLIISMDVSRVGVEVVVLLEELKITIVIKRGFDKNKSWLVFDPGGGVAIVEAQLDNIAAIHILRFIEWIEEVIFDTQAAAIITPSVFHIICLMFARKLHSSISALQNWKFLIKRAEILGFSITINTFFIRSEFGIALKKKSLQNFLFCIDEVSLEADLIREAVFSSIRSISDQCQYVLLLIPSVQSCQA